MDYHEAIKFIKRGRAVRRASWKNGVVMDKPKDSIFGRITIGDGRGLPRTPTVADLNADDWELVT